ncbi:uncharacterized protein [Nicotiana sylvestris]|uniref:uncharacterized protein n=1 Tax=Nicotiana sylvestris TaxID=4096 RepID=UPI00388CB51B
MGMTHEGNDIFHECFVGVEDVSDLDPLMATKLYWEVFKKSQAELSRCEADLKKLIEEIEALKRLYVQKEEELRNLQAELALDHKKGDELDKKKETLLDQLALVKCELRNSKGENLARSQKIDELEAKSAADLAKAKSEAEAFVASYRADTEASNIRAQEISIATEAKALEDEDTTLLSNDENSAIGSESRGDEDEALEEEVPDGVAPEDVAPKIE